MKYKGDVSSNGKIIFCEVYNAWFQYEYEYDIKSGDASIYDRKDIMSHFKFHVSKLILIFWLAPHYKTRVYIFITLYLAFALVHILMVWRRNTRMLYIPISQICHANDERYNSLFRYNCFCSFFYWNAFWSGTSQECHLPFSLFKWGN